MSTRIIGFAALLCCFILNGCNRQTSAPPQRRLNASSQPLDKKIVAGYNDFGFRLLRDLSANNKENVLIAPHSIATVLAMVNNGARGQTQSEINQVLGLNALSQQKQNEANAALHDALIFENSPTTLNIANAVWAQQGASFEKPFLSDTQRYFDAQVGQLDFANPASVKTVTDWVKTKTGGMIPGIVDNFSPSTMMVLANAVYFQAAWKTPFERSSTRMSEFHLEDGKTKRVPMMSQKDHFSYFVEGKHADNDEETLVEKHLEAVALPYEDERLKLYLFLPGPKKALDSLISQFNSKNWQRWMKEFSSYEGTVSLPRFEMSYVDELIEPMQKMGIQQLFKPGKADLSGIRKENDLFVSAFRHKTVIKVYEEGTEAAAATATQMNALSIHVPFQFTANRPFLVVLYDSQTNAILFLGAVRNPE